VNMEVGGGREGAKGPSLKIHLVDYSAAFYRAAWQMIGSRACLLHAVAFVVV
jgi:hypothetical protein